ncbi:MBL fold metallo-hydrolase [Halorubrum vacuolatum]|uniref:L-ascorbate metabolism protein UlaG, beta-lactamase superfamily n=1 Tax=Halorubrum vacuolatum TaxID=63740 RepID=A0A238XZ76_HALVU|nr:MBL fold metallo-hydrolase [Halorubrum vacuolatum]SNR63868.1 L-ascorbate metabolism protein UlaG, beta-lactamase superfamily [Halorubrum vacuolatum]
MTVRYDGFRIDWLGYATARIETAGGFTTYTDPGRYGVLSDYWARDGDLVLVTHGHHYDPAGIRSVAEDGATVVIHEAVDAAVIDREVESVSSLAEDFDVVRVDDEARVNLGARVESAPEDATVWSVAAYNRPDGPCAEPDGTVPHPAGSGCGYLLSVDGRRVFWPGDGDALAGYAELEVDVLLGNIGGGGIVSDRHETAALVGKMRPELVVPIHYDTFPALEADARAFAADVASRSVAVALDEGDRSD